jgi:hypothetical protein|tara:strand:+ start:468 stop:716 length:249 start_codon:yes stop_codon:yes gene_type:complete
MSDGPETCDCAVCRAITAIQGKPRDEMLAIFRRMDRPTQATCGSIHRISVRRARKGDAELVAKASDLCTRRGSHWSTSALLD